MVVTDKTQDYFEHDADIGIIGRGLTLLACFENVARAMFALTVKLDDVKLIKIITFDFEEEDNELALITWLNTLLAKAQEHHLMFSDFRLKRQGNKWMATVSGEPWRTNIERGIEVKGATLSMLTIKKIDYFWEARLIVDV